MQRKLTLRTIGNIVLPYWWSEERWIALGLLSVIVGLNLGLVYITVLFNNWNRLFYDSLQNKDFVAFKEQLIRFAMLALIYIAIAVYRIYLNQMLEMKWRRWLTEKFLDRWMDKRVYYTMELTGTNADNPDQRISEDLRLFTSGSLSLSIGLLSALVSLFSFVGILWALSGSLSFNIWGFDVVIPGYMVWVALVYSFIGSYVAHRIGRQLIGLNFQQQRFEADFRFNLVRVRENSEGIALYGGEIPENANLNSRFAHILSNWWSIMTRQKYLTWFTASYNQVAVVFPFFVAAPRFFSGAIKLGEMMQIFSAFANVQSSLSWFVENYRGFAEWKASVNRLTTFSEAVAQAEMLADFERRPKIEECADAEIRVTDLALEVPGGREIVSNLSFSLNEGERLLVKGPSGSGKSTLFRALAGIWPFGRGQICFPKNLKRFFLPQKPYIPLGTLREAISYPAALGTYSDILIQEVLKSCRLESLVKVLDETHNWSQKLSLGEQQKLAFARLLLNKPDIAFLDEATSSLDDESQNEMYNLLNEELAGATIISIAHRSAVESLHEKRLEM